MMIWKACTSGLLYFDIWLYNSIRSKPLGEHPVLDDGPNVQLVEGQ